MLTSLKVLIGRHTKCQQNLLSLVLSARIHRNNRGIGKYGSFSSSKLILSQSAQNAVVGLLLIDYIRKFQPQNFLTCSLSIRELIVSKEGFRAFIIDEARKIDNSISSLQEMGLTEDSINEVSAGFQMNKGAVYNRIVYSQARVSDATTTKQANIQKSPQVMLIKKNSPTSEQNSPISDSTPKIIDQNQIVKKYYIPNITVLNPTSISSKIMTQIYVKKKIIISGSKGVGKSFTYLLYPYLASFVLKERLNPNKCPELNNKLYRGLLKDEYNSYLSQITATNAQRQPKQIKEDKDSIQNKFRSLMKKRVGFFNVQKLFYFPITNLMEQPVALQTLLIQAEQLTQQQIKQVRKKFNDGEHAKLSCAIFQLIGIYSGKKISCTCVIDEANVYYSHARKYFNRRSLLQHYYRSPKTQQTLSNISLWQEQCLQNESNLKMYSKRLKCFEFFPNLVLNSSQIIQQKLLRQELKNRGFYSFYAHEKSDAFNINLDYSKWLKSIEGQIQLYTVFWFQLTAHLLINKNLIEDQIRRIRPFFEETFGLTINTQINNAPNLISWKYDIRPLGIKQYLKDNSTIQLGKYIKNNNKTEIINELKKLKENIERKYEDQLEKNLTKLLQKKISSFDEMIRIQIILHIRSTAFLLMEQLQYIRDKTKQTFVVSLNGITLMINNQDKSSEVIRQHIQLLAPELNIGTLKDETLEFQISYHPEVFIQKTNFMFRRGKKFQFLKNIYSMYLNNSKRLITGLQAGRNLDKFASVLFERGYFSFYFTAKTLKGEQSNHIYNVREGFLIQPWNKKFFIRSTFSQMIKKARKTTNWISGAPNNQTNEGFDVILMQKQANTFNITSIDVTVSEISTKFSKAVTQQRINNTFNLINLIQKWSAIKYSPSSIKKFNKFAQQYDQQAKSKETAENLSQEKYREILLSVREIAYIINQQQKRNEIIKQLQQAKIQSMQDVISFIKLIMKGKFSIPIELEKLQALQHPFNKHHFYIPLQHLLFYDQPQNIVWNHVIVAPQSKTKQYFDFLKKRKNKENNKNITKNAQQFSYRSISWEKKNVNIQISFSVASLNFDSIKIHDEPINFGQRQSHEYKLESKPFAQSMKDLAQKSINKLQLQNRQK